MRQRISGLTLIFLIILAGIFPVKATTNEGYGEDQTSLGQFVDSFEDSGNVSVTVNVIRNATLEAMELNYSIVRGYGNFTNYIEFDVDYNRVDSNLTDFPILLVISDGSGIDNQDITAVFDEIGTSYLKIAVTNTSMLSEYYVEVEYWDSTAEIGILWIAPDVSSLENTTLRLHFDSGVANNTVYVGLPGSAVASNVWDNNFVFVSHMNDNPDNQHIIDSTQYDNDGTKLGANEPIEVEGMIGDAQDFDGLNDYLMVLDDSSLNVTKVTVELWVNTSDWTQDYRTILSKSEGVGANLRWEIRTRSTHGRAEFVARIANTNYWIGSPVLMNDIWIELTMVVDGSQFWGYVDGVALAPQGAVGNLDESTADLYMGVRTGLGSDFGGIIDEVRISNISRSADWVNATFYCGSDDLIYWDPSVVEPGAGYLADGYFTTVDYLSDPLVNGSALVALVNTSIPASTQILLEFSEDNITWVLNDWDPLFGGFEAIDLRDLNYSAGYHCRFNLSTTDTRVTPRVYQNRLITTIGNVSTVYQNLTGEWIYYNLTAINVSTGIHDDGFLNSTYFIDGDTYNCSEVVGVPGYVVDFNVTGIDTRAISLWLVNYVYYDGSASHEVNVEVWNFTSSAFVEIGEIPDMLGFEWQNFSVYGLRVPNDFVNSTGALVGRFYHADAGNINHDIYFDRINVLAFVPLEAVAPADEVFQFFWIVLAIALMLIGIVISKMWFEAGDS